MSNFPKVWTPERKAQAVRRFVDDGWSATEVAVELGCGITRNSVIGTLSRMGIRRGADCIRETSAQQRRRRNGPPKPPQPPKLKPIVVKPMPVPPRAAPRPEPTPRTNPIPLMALKRFGQCRWPIGMPSDEGFGFCGAECEKIYCVRHAAIAFSPTPPKKIRLGGRETRT